MNNDIGSQIRKYRKLRGLTQEQLAELAELDTKHITRLESGKHIPNAKTLKKLADALNVAFADLEPSSNEVQNQINSNPAYINCLKIINSAKNDTELKNYLSVLKLAQKLMDK